MILALWIAMRMTVLGIAGEPAPGKREPGHMERGPMEGAQIQRDRPQLAALRPEPWQGSPASGREGGTAAPFDPAAGLQSGADPVWPGFAPYTPFPDRPPVVSAASAVPAVPAGAAAAEQAAPLARRERAPGLLRRWWAARKAQLLAVFSARRGSGAATGDAGENDAEANWQLPPGSGAGAQRPVLSFLPAPAQTREALRQPPGGPAGAAAPLVVAASGASARRWSADGWMLLRGGDSAPALAAGAASYGGSQAGAVLRYRLAPSSPLAPHAYLRTSGALGGTSGQAEAALGLMLRPVRRLPLALLGEVRLQNQSGLVAARPVIMGVTQLPPQRLPLGFEGEAYAQGGWAGGRDATAFYDLATTVQHPLARPLQRLDLSAGGGLWSGGQRGAARLDLGPRIELRTMIGPQARRIGVRVGVDWRFRIAGKAEPGSGPALTVAAGF